MIFAANKYPRHPKCWWHVGDNQADYHSLNAAKISLLALKYLFCLYQYYICWYYCYKLFLSGVRQPCECWWQWLGMSWWCVLLQPNVGQRSACPRGRGWRRGYVAERYNKARWKEGWDYLRGVVILCSNQQTEANFLVRLCLLIRCGAYLPPAGR